MRIAGIFRRRNKISFLILWSQQSDVERDDTHGSGTSDYQPERRASGDVPHASRHQTQWSGYQFLGSQGSSGTSANGDDIEGERAPRSWARRSQRGRGPRGYYRSDERLQELICERLTDDSAVDASEIEVFVSSREVTLRGTVYDRWTKFRTELLVENCGGVREIHNQLRLAPTGLD